MIRIEEELVVNNKTIDARILSRMFLAGAKNLEAKKEWINELNVFPVPDGDTGTNMTMTIMAAAAGSRITGRVGYGDSGKSDFFRFSARCKRKFRCNPFPASPRLHQECENNARNWMQKQSQRLWRRVWRLPIKRL